MNPFLIRSLAEPLDYDDILLIPNSSNIESRNKVNLCNKDGYIPIFSSPMQNISEPNFVVELGKLGGIGILHRFFDNYGERQNAITQIGKSRVKFGIAIGLHDWQYELDIVAYSQEYNCQFVVIDTASGYLSNTINAIKSLYNFRETNAYNFKIIAGNVVDWLGANNLAKAGADIIRVNIGQGLQCLTSTSIGIGCPALTAIADCLKIQRYFPNVQILADGGIYNPGNALKAFIFGADAVMIGSLFGRARECENNGIIYGMSSYTLQDRMNKARKSNEGKVTIIPSYEIRPLEEIFSEFTYGLKSGLSYLGIDDISKIHETEITYIENRSRR